MTTTKKRVFQEENVLNAAKKRIEFLFDEFEEIQVSVSGGKDSTALLYLCLEEAEKRQRHIEVFFLDQEAEYQATIDVIKHQMSLKWVIPKWYQIPIYLTNATSYSDCFLYAWGENENWMREKTSISIHKIHENHPKRFYEFFPYLEKKNPKKAFLVGLRADESITRYRAVTKNPGYKGLRWSTTTNTGANRFYPIYDWGWSDVWKYIYDNRILYNKMYDMMFWSNYSMYKMRVSNLIHEKSYKCLQDLPRFEPETYDKLCDRISGISSAHRYASEKTVFSNKVLPKHYNTWKEFRDFLLQNIPQPEYRERFKNRFQGQPENEKIYQQQVGQLLLNDFENSKSIDLKKNEKTEAIKEKWRKIL